MASKKSSKGKDGKVNKSAFIRSQPSTLSAGEVVEKAKAAGIELTAGLVYAIRSASKGKTSSPKVSKAVVSPAGLGGFEGAIRNIVRQELKAILSKL
jgi:hypothetical protein